MSITPRREMTAIGAAKQPVPIRPDEPDDTGEFIDVGLDGKLERVFVTDILVDQTYQRYLNEKRVNAIVRDFDQNIIGVLYLSRRDDGKLYALDGQHRKTAVEIKYGGRARLLCFIVEHLTRQQEADVFWKTNKWRLLPSSSDAMRARLEAGEEIATAIKAITDQAGVVISLSPGTLGTRHVHAFATLDTLYANGTLATVCWLIRQAWPDEEGAFKAMWMNGIDRLLTEFRPYFLANDSNANDRLKRLVKVMSQRTPDDFQKRANFYRNSEDERAARAFARALHDFYNKGLGIDGYTRLPLWPENSGRSVYDEVRDGR